MSPPTGGVVGSAVRNPVTIAVGVLLITLFGLQAFFLVPVQLTPDVSRPKITVQTRWPGANPREVEREIVKEQEDVLKALEGLLSMQAECSPGSSQITLEFVPGTDLDAALLKVNNALNQVPAYPEEADRPILSTSGAREDAIGWFIFLPADEQPRSDIDTFQQFVEDEVKTRFERVPGVARANIFGGRERQIEVLVDPGAVAARGLTLRQIAARLAEEDRDTSAGHFDEGKRRYTLRAVGAFDDPKEIAGVVLREGPRDRVFLRDVATVRRSYKDPEVVVRYKGIPCIAINVQRRTGSNILDIMNGVKQQIRLLNEGPLGERGLKILQAYDATIYIRSALELVQQNILLGGLLAILVLWVFLRSIVPTLIISVAIPVSAVGTFLFMFLLGRNINVVSLAGLSFAVGMLVDNSIVVLESIIARVEKGDKPFRAAVDGTQEVWGAVVASTLTTVAVFLPIFFLQAEVAQIFRDIAIAIACAVILSLVVSVLAIPAMFVAWMKGVSPLEENRGRLGPSIVRGLTGLVHWICGSVMLRVLTVVLLTGVSLGGSWLLTPPAEYLPEGNQNLLFAMLIPPAGYNLEEFERIGESIADDLRPLWSGDDPSIEKFFYVAFGRQVIMGVGATDPARIRELKGPVQAALGKIPGMIAIVLQPGLFSHGLSGGRSIDLKLQGPELESLMKLAQRAFFGVMKNVPGAQARPIPGLELGQPEIQMLPDRQRLAEVGLSTADLGFTFDVLTDGARVSEVQAEDGQEIDLVLRGKQDRLRHTQDLGQLQVYVPNEGLVPLSSLAQIKATVGPDVIQRYERQRSVSIQINPPLETPLESAMDAIREKIMDPMVKDGSLGGTYSWLMAGTADKLTATKEALQGGFGTALIVTYLLMASLFESFLFPLVIMFSVPLAAFGGFVAMRLVDVTVASTRLDVLTMLGFIILIGVVVNNAILLVDRSLRTLRRGESTIRDAVAEAVTSRIRPIFMSTLTSVFGLAPLVLMRGAGSELYRGIGSVVIGGVLVSTVFTLVLIPALLSLVLEIRQRVLG